MSRYQTVATLDAVTGTALATPTWVGGKVRAPWRTWSSWVVVVLVSGCTGSAAEDPTPDAVPDTGGDTLVDTAVELVVTPGLAGGVALSDSDPVTLLHGPVSGLWYLDVGGRVQGSEREVSVAASVTVPELDDLRVVEQVPLFLSLDDYDAAARSGTFDLKAFVDTGYPPSTNLPADPRAVEFICSLEGATLEYSLTVTELVGSRSGAASAQVVAVLDPVDVEDCGG
jgi:hypothetical protein